MGYELITIIAGDERCQHLVNCLCNHSMSLNDRLWHPKPST